MSSLNVYLAKRYGAKSTNTQGESSKKKKKKVKSTPAADKQGSVAIIDEEDITGQWKNIRSEDEEDEEAPIVDFSTETQQSSKWKPIVDDIGDEAPQIVNASNELLEYISSEVSEEPKPKRHKSSPPIKTSSGLDVGLQSADKVRKDLKRVKKDEKDLVNKMDPSLSGRGAATIYRDNVGTKIDKAAKRAEERRKIEEEEKLLKWGKEEENRREEELLNKPLAIYKDDKDLNEELKAKERWNDPAEMFLTKKKNKKKAGDRPRYQGPPAPPNRFNIQPGFRWDGIDRSNGYERQYFEKRNTRAALASEAYKWSVEDMLLKWHDFIAMRVKRVHKKVRALTRYGYLKIMLLLL
ncbi:Pre-mRNA-splicing factor of RES complex-domain-containing protein [Glomus cerebriforme]|uniref:Pre-mRNA-splicing factor of RES complex-domain-containing protein n=1 Tax=Glomus cerebriforme TaxID=658196 RepID=A0A397SSP2_9GLOM|nr:Pre-mRNA-splicing factor of RES complex-domain-containing protein [Glomus cerebriforme]